MWVGFVARAVLEVVEGAVEISQYESVVSFALVTVGVNIVPEVVGPVFCGGVDCKWGDLLRSVL